MSITALDESKLELILPSTKSRAYIGPLLACPECDPSAIPVEAEQSSDPSINCFGCLRGAAFGLCIEAAACLCLYGIWHLWHTL